MTDINDLYQPGDEREPEPCEWYPAPEPVDLEEVEKRLERLKFLAPPFGMVATRAELNGTEDLHDLSALIGQEAHGLIAELREARRRIAEFEALEKREEWSWSEDPAAEPTPGAYKFMSAKRAFAFAAGRPVWQRTLTVRPWQPISPGAPF